MDDSTTRKRTAIFQNAVVSVFCVALFISSVSAYDGPVGVTFRAPFIKKGCINALRLERISIRTKVRVDNNWSLTTDGKGRAFPSEFIGTIADSMIVFVIRNQGRSNIATDILIPFDSSDTNGTGFRKPLAITASSGGRRAGILRGPELARGMVKLRSFRVPVEIPSESTLEVDIIASHPLAVNPAWFQFICSDRYVHFPSYETLATAGCDLEFELESADEMLKESPLKFQWKKISDKESHVERKHDRIRFRGESIEWVRVFR